MADMTLAQMQARMQELEAQLAQAQKARTGKLTLKVGAKGGVSVYGLGRWPVTLYAEQWARILTPGFAQELAQFVADHNAELSSKAQKA